MLVHIEELQWPGKHIMVQLHNNSVGPLDRFNVLLSDTWQCVATWPELKDCLITTKIHSCTYHCTGALYTAPKLTRIIPALAVANWKRIHSYMLGPQTPSRSPRFSPRARRPAATLSTCTKECHKSIKPFSLPQYASMSWWNFFKLTL